MFSNTALTRPHATLQHSVYPAGPINNFTELSCSPGDASLITTPIRTANTPLEHVTIYARAFKEKAKLTDPGALKSIHS